MARSDRAVRLTKRAVDGATPTGSRYVVPDLELSGFRLVVSAAGKKSFYYRYRVGGGRGATIREPKIGDYGAMTVDHARTQARIWAAEVAKGGDPSGARQSARTTPNMNELFDRFIAEHSRLHKKPSSVAEDERIIEHHLRPALGTTKVSELTLSQAAKLHAQMHEKPYRANRCLALLSKALNLAEKWGLRPRNTNFIRDIQKYDEKPRRRFLDAAELSRLGNAFTRAENDGLAGVSSSALLAIRLLLLTGCRKSEILSLRWRDVDLDGRRMTLPDSKTGFRSIPLNTPTVDLLRRAARDAENPYVVVGMKPGCPLTDLKKPWRRICKAAEIEGLRIHDLRHTFGAIAAGSGHSLRMVGALLGHRNEKTTMRYAHLSDDPQRAASDAVGASVMTALSSCATYERED